MPGCPQRSSKLKKKPPDLRLLPNRKVFKNDVGEDGGGLKKILGNFTCRTLGEDESILKRAYIFFNIFQMGC